MFDQILLAVDGSEHALRAAKVAGDLARAVNVKELLMVVAYEPVPALLGEPNFSNAINERMNETQAILEDVEAAIGEVPAEVTSELLEGHIAESIIDVANARHSDLIVMGSRGRGALAGALLGSNSRKVISRAPCPVLVVR